MRAGLIVTPALVIGLSCFGAALAGAGGFRWWRGREHRAAHSRGYDREGNSPSAIAARVAQDDAKAHQRGTRRMAGSDDPHSRLLGTSGELYCGPGGSVEATSWVSDSRIWGA